MKILFKTGVFAVIFSMNLGTTNLVNASPAIAVSSMQYYSASVGISSRQRPKPHVGQCRGASGTGRCETVTVRPGQDTVKPTERRRRRWRAAKRRARLRRNRRITNERQKKSKCVDVYGPNSCNK